MRFRSMLVLFVFSAATLWVPAEAAPLPVDEDAVVAEMEELIDATPPLDAKAQERVMKLLQKGVKAHDAHDYDRAIELYREALEIDPVSSLAYYEIAFAYTVSGRQEQALDAIIRSLTLDPKQEGAHIMKASILDDLGFADRAKQAYRELLEIQPDSYMGHLNLGITLTRVGELEDAEVAYRRAVEIDPEHPSGYLALARLFGTQGHDYDEEAYLEKFLEVGEHDPRREYAETRLEEMRHYEVSLDSEHPYTDIEILEEMARVTWQTTLHRETFPDARGYELTYEEDRDVYDQLLEGWRAKKKEDPEAAYGPYDLLLQIDDAGFLDEYIYYHRQLVFGERASRWMDLHAERMTAFVDWAKAEGLMSEEPDGDADDEPSVLETVRGLPGELMQQVIDSEIVYSIGAETERPTGLLEDERERYARTMKLSGEDRVQCRKASRGFDESVTRLGNSALTPILRCFAPGTPEHDHVMRRAGGLGLDIREVDFRPLGDVVFGEDVQIAFGDAWLMYMLAKAAWRSEPQLREEYGGPPDAKRASLAEEIYAVAVLAGAYQNSFEPDEQEDPDAEPWTPPERVPALERLLGAIDVGLLRAYVLYEVVHQAYGVPLDRLSENDANAVEKYIHGFVVVRRSVVE